MQKKSTKRKNKKNDKTTQQNKRHWVELFSSKAIKAAGSNSAFIIACIIIVTWAATGPLFHFSNTWQLVINTGTGLVIFLMVFLIQKAQNKDSIAIQIKLNELVAANINASNRIVSVEDLSEAELIRLNEYYTRLAEITKKEKNLKAVHSIEDTTILKDEKNRLEKKIGDLTQ